ncbi:glucans biosynthesis glucosyltransferase MdoH [Acuticoccus sp.]|uniref:glucans biosynthesis glucosyltransferase MdoH n=1 Tax=Acuticoccus sp. TaxID=1904378 RepID=UPI003B51FF5A
MDKLTFTPTAAPLAMPTQNLGEAPPRRGTLHRPMARTLAARLLLIAITLGGTVFAALEMHAVAQVGGMATLEWALVAVFSVAFAWIAFAAANAIVGLLAPSPRPAAAPSLGGPLTALVMPIYNENVSEVYSALAAMVADLPREVADRFEVFLLSDSTDAETWIAEERALAILRRRAGPTRVWYRRRRTNAGRKAGNVADFVTRWGGRYAHMIVLDADSLMTGDCLCALRSAMEAEPSAGIIQTAPVLLTGATPFARAQAFASAMTGPVISRGLAAWSGDDGNYWGHNAIIRMEAFAGAAGLPTLRGRPPLGGPILSHDFVEAALVRRAGWTVTLRHDIEGSYEGAPGDLIGVIRRDRRWAQGNLQHLRVLTAAGLLPASRLHLAIGILAYLMSPLWLLLILTGLALAVQATFIRPEYFPEAFALFPTWPAFDAPRMTALLAISLAVLLVPKAMGLAHAIADPAVRQRCGGTARLAASSGVELLVSTLVAPIMMLAQTQIVAAILSGRAVGWMPQVRRGSKLAWRDALAFHAPHSVTGLAMAVVAVLHSPVLSAWMAPTLLSLLAAAPISRAAGSRALARRLRRGRLMTTPQEVAPPVVLLAARRLSHEFPHAKPADALMALAADPVLRVAHASSLEPATRGRGAFEPARALAVAKLGEATSLDEYASWLAPDERLAVVSEPALLDRALSLGRASEAEAA